MEKILLAINPAKINVNTIDFACYIANLTGSKLTAVFLKHLKREETPSLKAFHGGVSVESVLQSDLPQNSERLNQWEQNVHVVENACKNRGVTCCIHRDKGVPTEDVVFESRFADMLIVDAEMSFHDKPETLPTEFVREVLAKSECPVVIAPYSFYGINEIVFADDGSASSAFAIKQFSYLLPELSDKKITILQVDESGDLPTFDNHKIREFLQMHYGAIEFKFLHGKASDKLYGYLLLKKDAFVVMGAFGRNMLSTFFKHSTAELLIKTINAPIFIAHH
ncbi:MAG TPA: universal stress protein [Flavitalea sp.]|nr:universal stress protein [Flavitalea sp.]